MEQSIKRPPSSVLQPIVAKTNPDKGSLRRDFECVPHYPALCKEELEVMFFLNIS